MTRKKRNNARKSAAREIQQQTGLRYKKALARLDDAQPAPRIITAEEVYSFVGPIFVYGLSEAVRLAHEALELPPPRPAWAPDWWKPSRPISGWECLSEEAYAVLTAIQHELLDWALSAEKTYATDRLEESFTAAGPRTASSSPNGGSVYCAWRGAPLRLELPAASALRAWNLSERLSEPLARDDWDSPWIDFVVERLDDVRQQLVPFAGVPVDELRSEVDRLARWLQN